MESSSSRSSSCSSSSSGGSSWNPTEFPRARWSPIGQATGAGSKVTINPGWGSDEGDIVVFRNPDGASDHDILVKRVIATAGQTVDLQGGVVYVDGEPLSEAYAQGDSYPLRRKRKGFG